MRKVFRWMPLSTEWWAGRITWLFIFLVFLSLLSFQALPVAGETSALTKGDYIVWSVKGKSMDRSYDGTIKFTIADVFQRKSGQELTDDYKLIIASTGSVPVYSEDIYRQGRGSITSDVNQKSPLSPSDVYLGETIARYLGDEKVSTSLGTMTLSRYQYLNFDKQIYVHKGTNVVLIDRWDYVYYGEGIDPPPGKGFLYYEVIDTNIPQLKGEIPPTKPTETPEITVQTGTPGPTKPYETPGVTSLLPQIVEMYGKAQIMKAGTDKWIDATPGTTLRRGDKVRTGLDGWVELTFPEGAKLRLRPQSLFEFPKYEESCLNLTLSKGGIWAFIKLMAGMCRVYTPTAVAGVRGTEFTVEVAEDNATTVTVLEGVVEVQDLASKAMVLLNANQRITVPKTPGGLGQQEMLQRVATIDQKLIDRWWAEMPSATARPPEIQQGTPSGGFAAGPIAIVVILVLVVLAVFVIKRMLGKGVQLLTRKEAPRVERREAAHEGLETLKLRLARGEITKEEYEEMRKISPATKQLPTIERVKTVEAAKQEAPSSLDEYTENKRLIDSLNKRFAEGAMSEEIYKKLLKEFETKLDALREKLTAQVSELESKLAGLQEKRRIKAMELEELSARFAIGQISKPMYEQRKNVAEAELGRLESEIRALEEPLRSITELLGKRKESKHGK